MAGAAGCLLRLRVCRVEARAEVPVVKVWGSLEDTKEEHRSQQQSPQAAAVLFAEQSRPQAVLGELCLVEVNGEWQRCKVLLKRGAECQVFVLEEGTITSVSPSRLRKAQASLFFPLPPHMLVCALSGLVPPNGQHWNYSALNYFYSLQDKVITGQVQDLLPQGLVLLEASEIAQQALLCGLAKTIPALSFHPFLGCSSVTHHTPIPAMNGAGRGGPWQAESMDYYYPHLESGVTEQVVVTHVSEPHSIFCQLLSVAQEFHSLSEGMQHFYSVQTGPAYRSPLKLGQPCASRGADGRWYRSLLQEVFQERQLATVIHVDWGREELVPLTCLRTLAAEFLRLPVITFRCALYGISNGGKDWELSVIAELRSLLQGKQVSATIQFFNSYKHLYVVTLLAADGCNLNYFFGMQVQNRSSKSARASLCPEEKGEKIGTPKLPEENFYVPTFSTVELKTGTFYDAMVQYVFDPSNFYVQTEEDSAKHQKMVALINDMYSKASRLEGIITKPKPGQICCAKFKDGTYYRAEVIACETRLVKVYFLDHGNVELIDWYNIKELPAEFKELSALANRCCLVDIYPLGESWSPEAIHAFKVAVVHRKLVLYVMSKDLDKYTVEVLDQCRVEEKNVGKALSLAGHAKYEELETITIVHMGESGGSKTTPSQPVSTLGLSETEQQETTSELADDERIHYSPYEDQLFEPGATIEVIVSHIENPGLFWCQNAALASALNNLMDSIQMYCGLTDKAPEPDANACFAKSPKNGTWYRGFITEIPVSETKSNSVEVLYVDYGVTEMVPAVNLRAMESSFFNVKSHAFKCSLYNIIAPLGKDPFYWDSKATDAFCDFAVKASKGREFHCMFFATAFVDKELINIVDLYTPFENICANLAKRGFATYLFHKTLEPSVHLQSFYYSLHDIKTGSEEEVSITHVNPSLEFYCQLSRNTGTLAKIAEAITKACKKTQCLNLPSAVPLCLAKFTDQQWYRAFICSETDGAEVFFVDYGNTEKVAADDLRPIVHSEHDLLLLPMQAIKCSLSDIPLILPEEVMTWFEGVVWDRALRALVVAKEADGKLLVELYDGNEQINATLKSKLGLNVPKNALACKPAFCPSSQPSSKLTQQEAKTVSGERKTCEPIQGQSSHTRGSNVASTDSSTALPKRDRSSPCTQMPFEQQADRDYNAKYREPSSQKRDTLPFQSNTKRALYQDNQECSVRRKEVTKFQSSQRNYEQPSSQNSKPNFGKELQPKPNLFAKPCGSTPKQPLTKISEISTRSISPGKKLCVYASHALTMFDFYVQTTETGLLDQISDFLNRDKSTFEEVSEKDVNIGDVICALFDGDKLYYRGVVEQKSTVGLNVLYIDYGNTSVISNCKIYKLPQNLCSIPAQSIHCSLNSTKGASSVSNSPEILEMFYERVFDQQLECEFIKLEDGKWDVDLYDKRGRVNDLLTPLVEEKKGKVTSEFKARQEDVPVIKSFTWNLPKTGKTVKVFASAVDSPGLFWCQLSTTDFDALAKQVQEAGEKSVRDDHFIGTIGVGSLCNVMYSEDQNWYRALVSKLEADVATVRFVDYGNVENVGKEEIRQLPNTLVSLPTQAFPCCLAKFNVAAGTWTSEGCDYFFQRATEDVLELTVEDIQHDEMCKMPLALVRLKYNEMDINEEMKRFWQVGEKESSNLAKSVSSKPDIIEGRQTVEEKQLDAEELDWPIPSMEDEADQNIALDTCHAEPTVEWQTRPENVAGNKSFTWNFPQTLETVKVFASAVDSPGLFWCQLSTTDFDALAKQVQQAGEKSVRDDHFIGTIGVGSLCNVMYSEDQNWYRALVSKMEADVATVRFVDYGNVENVVKDEIRQLPTTLASVPTQAFPCCLAGFNVAASKWTSEGCDYFFQHATEDVLELSVEDIQHDEMCKTPLALVRLKYNEMDINEEMKRFWQVGKKESSNLDESASSKPDKTEGRQTVEEKQLDAEELDWPIPSMEDEADCNMGFDLLSTEETEDDAGDSSTRDLRQTANEEEIGEEEVDQGIEHLVESKDDQAYEKLVETISHKDSTAGDVIETGYECHGGLVSYSSSLEYDDDDYSKHECLAKEEFKTEESATYKVIIESEEPIDDTLQDPTPEYVDKSEDTEESKVFVLPIEKDILEGEKHSAYACVVENQELVINEDATMQILATGVLAESENEDATNVNTVEAVVGEIEKSEEAITFVDSVEALEFSDTGVCEAVEAITYIDEEDFLAICEHQEFEAITFVDHIEPVAISEHVEAITYVDSTDALAIGELEVITFMDSAVSITDGEIGECQEVEAMTHVDSVEAMFSDIVEPVVGGDEEVEDIVEPVVIGEYEEVDDIVEPVVIDEYEEVDDIVEPVVISEYEEVDDIVEPVVIGEYAEVEDIVEPLVIGDYEEVEDREEPIVIGEYEEAEDIVEPVVIGEYDEVEDIVEPLVIGEYEELEDRVELVITGECEEVEDRAEPVAISECEEDEVATFVHSIEAVTTGDITECEKVEAITYEGSVKAVAVGDICEHEGVEDIIYVDMVEAVAVRNTNESEEVEAVTYMDCVEHAAVGDIECIEAEAEYFSDIDEIEENKTINYMDSAEHEAGNTGDSEEIKDFTYVTSEVAVNVPDTGEPQVFKAFTSVDNVKTVAVCDIGESKNSGGDIIDTAVESLIVSSQVTVGPEGALVRDDQLQREDDATGEGIVKSEESVDGAGIMCREESVTSSDIKMEVVFKMEDFIGITKLVRSEDCGPSEDTKECEETLGSRDVTETLEAKQWNQVWELEIDVSNEDLRENTIPEITRDVALQHSGQQFQEQDCPGEVEGCCVGEDSENASSHTLEHQDKQPDLFTLYRDQPLVETSSEVMHGSDSDSSTDRETLETEDKQADLFTGYRDQPGVKTSPEVMYENYGDDSSTDQETLNQKDKLPDLFTVYRDQPLVKTSSELMHGSDGGDSSTDRETLDKEDKQPDIFTVCRDQPEVKTSPDVIYGSDDSESSTDRETLEKEGNLHCVCRVFCITNKQPDIFTVYRDQFGVKTGSEVMYESDVGNSLADQDTLNKENIKAAEPCCIRTDQPLAITRTENKNEGDLGDTSRDMDNKDKQPDLFTVYRDKSGVEINSEVMYESDGGDSFADQDTLDKEDKKAAEPCCIDTDQPLAITSTENKNEGDLGDTSRDMDDKGKRRSDLFTVYRDSPAVISSTESISSSDVSDPSVEDVAIISREAVGYALPVCCAAKVLPEDEEDHRGS